MRLIYNKHTPARTREMMPVPTDRVIGAAENGFESEDSAEGGDDGNDEGMSEGSILMAGA